MNILVIAAHPDDASIFCGGTIAKHVSRGDDVHVTYMTRGEYGGSGEQTQEQLADQREEEVKQAADVLGMSVSFKDFYDGRLENTIDNRRIINGDIRRHRPDLILTHYKDDPHPDHRVTSQLVRDAYFMASLPMVDNEFEPCDPDNIYFFGRWSTTTFDPQIHLDITDMQDTKERAIECHQSQINFLEQHGGIDSEFGGLIEDTRAEARTLGRRANVRFAEGFIPFHRESVDYMGN